MSAALAVLVVLVALAALALAAAGAPAAGAPEKFVEGWSRYRPACAGPQGERRGSCRGLTTAAMPSIEEDSPISWAPCCGALGVPPPDY